MPTITLPRTAPLLMLAAQPARWTFSTPDEFSRQVAPEIPRMLRSARAILVSEDLAWDAVQEALLRVWRQGLRKHGCVAALRRLAVLSALHLARCHRRRRFHEEQVSAELPCCSEDPLVDVASTDLRQVLRNAIARITQPYREVLELYVFEGRDYQEIADALAVPIGTVRSRLSRARRELREHIPAPSTSDASD